MISASICGAQIGEIKGDKWSRQMVTTLYGSRGLWFGATQNKSVKTVKKGDHVIMH